MFVVSLPSEKVPAPPSPNCTLEYLLNYNEESSKIKEPIENLKAFKTAKIFLGTVPKKSFESLKDSLKNFDKVYIEDISQDSTMVNLMVIGSKLEEKEMRNQLKTHSFTELNFDFKGSFEDEFERIKLREEEIKKANINHNQP